jgi:hypothetical protein
MLALSISLGLTLLVIAWPAAQLAYRGRELHVALETTGSLIALLGGVLMLGRFMRGRRLDDLLLALALVLFGVVDLGFLVLPGILARAGGREWVWTALAGRTVGAVALAVGALGLPRRVRRRRMTMLATLGPFGVFALAALAVLLSGRWPSGTPPAWSSGKAEPWPSAQEMRERRIRAAGGAPPRAKPTPAPQTAGAGASTPARSSAKRKRKRRK